MYGGTLGEPASGAAAGVRSDAPSRALSVVLLPLIYSLSARITLELTHAYTPHSTLAHTLSHPRMPALPRRVAPRDYSRFAGSLAASCVLCEGSFWAAAPFANCLRIEASRDRWNSAMRSRIAGVEREATRTSSP